MAGRNWSIERCTRCRRKTDKVPIRGYVGVELCMTCRGDVRGTKTWLAGRFHRPLKALCEKKRKSATSDRKARYDFTLTVAYFVRYLERPCTYCGAEQYGVHLDRVDNTKGYTAANTVSCCAPCNYAKGGTPVKQFLAWADRLGEHRRRLARQKKIAV